MKLTTPDNKTFKFNFLKQNIFVINNIETINLLYKAYEFIFSNKTTTKQFTIAFEERDISINKYSDMLIVIPNFFDFYNDIAGGGKTILKIFVSSVLKYDLFKSEGLTSLVNLAQTIDLSEIKTFDYLIKEINNISNFEAKLFVEDNFIEYLANQIILNINKDDQNYIPNQIEMRKIYLKIIELLIEYNDKNTHILFNNPFYGLDYDEILEYYGIINKIDNYTIITDKFIDINSDEKYKLKIFINNNIIDFSLVYDNPIFYSNFSIYTQEKDFINYTNNLIDDILINYNNYNFKKITFSPLIEYLINN